SFGKVYSIIDDTRTQFNPVDLAISRLCSIVTVVMSLVMNDGCGSNSGTSNSGSSVMVTYMSLVMDDGGDGMMDCDVGGSGYCSSGNNGSSNGVMMMVVHFWKEYRRSKAR
ncbi:hypothetical protein PENTCL1PPCAC_28229, partial [Pristionchus entomophagus]